MAEPVRIDAGPRPVSDADRPPADPPVALAVPPEPQPPPQGRGLAVPLLYGSLALAHLGGDERDRAVGAIYALLALHDLLEG